jgi:hypothetical protein
VTDRLREGLSNLGSLLTWIGLLVAAGSAVAAWNWHSIWTSFAVTDPTSRLALGALGRSSFWTTVSVSAMVVTVAAIAGRAWLEQTAQSQVTATESSL